MRESEQSTPMAAETNQVDGVRDSDYTREIIAGDHQVAPYTLMGLRRTLMLAGYVAIVGLSLAGVLYGLAVHPVIAIFGLVTAYIGNNLAFLLTHVRFHTSFIEVAERDMDLLVHHSFVHHYRDVQVYHKTWLETRMSYFLDARAGLSGAIFQSILPITLLASGLLCLVAPVLGIVYCATLWAAQLLQSTVHEWYHVPSRSRKDFYNPVLYGSLTLLERIGLASTRRHMTHHRHHLRNLDEVDHWLDLALPFGERLAGRLWRAALSRYEPGKTRMTDFVGRIIHPIYYGLHVVLSLAYVAVY